MEVNLRKRFSLPSWMAVGMLALGLSGGMVQVGNAADKYYDDTTTSLEARSYGAESPDGTYLKIDKNTNPGATPDPGMERGEDHYEFTQNNFTLGANGGTTSIDWKTVFGKRGAGEKVTMDIVGGTNIFDNQGIYIGSRAGDDGVGGEVELNISGGDNVFTQRVIVGGEGRGENAVAGKSTINISDGLNIFTYDKKFDWTQKVRLGDKEYTVGDITGNHKKYLGDGHVNGDGLNPDLAYFDVNEYNYYNNYYGVYFSAMAEVGSTATENTQGVDLNITGGKNIFNVVTYVGGGYDLNPYNSVNTSSDDNDVVWGGTNNVNISGGFTNFAARTYFGAAGSTTNVDFSGRSTTYFSGTQISEDMDRALAFMRIPVYNARFENSYNGGDLPYVYFGGKKLTDLDQKLSRNPNVPVGLESATTVNINGFNNNMTTVDFQTTAFFGGADERWLAGDQWCWSMQTVEDGETVDLNEPILTHSFIYGREDQESAGSGVVLGQNATRKDEGSATLNLKSGKMRIGYVNQTEIVKARNENNWNYAATSPNGYVFEPTLYQKRYEQIRLIGAATGSVFNADGGRIQFDTVVHAEQREVINAATDSLYRVNDFATNPHERERIDGKGYIGFFAEMPETVMVNGNKYLTLETGMIAFDNIIITDKTDITLGGMGNILARMDTINALEAGTVENEFYTNTVFVDTTGATSENGVDIASTPDGSDSKFAKSKYEKWFYTIELEDPNGNPAVDNSNNIRMHVTTRDYDEALVGNMGGNKETFTEVLTTQKPKPVYDAIEQIIASSTTAEEAAANFDQLIGTAYGNMAAAQVRRMSSFNSMMADQIIASDVCLKNLRKGNCGGQSCGQCDACNCCRNWTTWGSFYADGGKVDMHKYISGYDTNTYGAMVAIDWTNCESCHFGMFFNYAETDTESSAPMGYTNMTAETYGVGIYAKWLGLCCTGGYGQLIASVNITEIDSERELYLDDSFTGATDGILPSVFYERGWVFFPHDKLSINPFFGLQYVYYHSDAFTEDGLDEVGDPSALALNVGDIDHHSLRTLVGVRISRDWMLGSCHDRRFTTRFKGAWMHDVLGDCDPTFNTSHVGNEEFPIWNVRGNNAGRDWAILGLGADFNASERLSFLVDYNAYVNEYTTIHAGMATMRFTF